MRGRRRTRCGPSLRRSNTIKVAVVVVHPRPDGGDPAGSIGQLTLTVSRAHADTVRRTAPDRVCRPARRWPVRFSSRQRPPPGHPGGQLGVHRGHRRGVFDQRGCRESDQQVAEQPGREQGRHLRQPVAQRHRGWSDARHAGAAILLGLLRPARRPLRLAGRSTTTVLLAVGSPAAAVKSSAIAANLWAAAACCPPAGGVDQLGVGQRRQVRDLGQRTMEHAFEPAAAGDDP